MRQRFLAKMATCVQALSKHNGWIAMKFTEHIYAPKRINHLYFGQLLFCCATNMPKCQIWAQDYGIMFSRSIQLFLCFQTISQEMVKLKECLLFT